MFDFLRRRSREGGAEPADPAQRAERFWRRWSELLPEVSAALGENDTNRVEHQLCEAVADLHPNLHFALERGQSSVYALVVSAQGDPDLRAYTDAWMAAAPEPDPMWEYHDAVPPVPDPVQVTVNLGRVRLSLAEVRVGAQVDPAGLVDVAVFHPAFAELEEAARAALTFLPLDAALGERLAAERLGRVETAETEPQGAIGLVEFRDLVRGLG